MYIYIHSIRGVIMDNGTLQYKNFTSMVQFSANDNVFFGQIEGIDDLVSFEGANEAELRMAFEEAVEDYIEIIKDIRPVKI